MLFIISSLQFGSANHLDAANIILHLFRYFNVSLELSNVKYDDEESKNGKGLITDIFLYCWFKIYEQKYNIHKKIVCELTFL